MNDLALKPLKPLCIAHRGGPKDNDHNENSLTAINESLAAKSDAIEIDLWNIDGHLIAIHDRKLGRLIPGDQAISNLIWPELQALASRSGTWLLTLREIIDAINNQALLNIEIKGPNCATPLCDLLASLKKANSLDLVKIAISSFDHQQIINCKKLLPEIKIGALVYGIPHDLAQTAENLSAHFMGISIDFINEALVEDCHKRGIQAWVYTANDELDFKYLMGLSVDGIFTDYPQKLIAWQLKRSGLKETTETIK